MTAPATPTGAVTALDAIEAILDNVLECRCGCGMDVECECGNRVMRRAQSSVAVTRALVEAALARDASTLATLRDAEFALIEACAAYRAWTPAPATVTSGDSGGSGCEGRGGCMIYHPGARIRFDYGKGNVNNKLCHIRAVVDDDYIVFRRWFPGRGWAYFIETRDYLDMVIAKGQARVERDQ